GARSPGRPSPPRGGPGPGERFAGRGAARGLARAGDGGRRVWVARGGMLASPRGRSVPPSRLTWIDARGALTPLGFTPRPFVGLKLSPDGHHVATSSLEAGRLVIRLLGLERGAGEMPRVHRRHPTPPWLAAGRRAC